MIANAAIQTNEILVVKIGGGEGVDLAGIVADLAQVASERPVVVVHGVSAEANRLCEELGVPVRTLTSPSGHSSRYTDIRTRDVFVEAARNVSDAVVTAFDAHGIPAQRVERAIHGERKTAIRAVVDGRTRIIRDDYTGAITGVDTAAVQTLLAEGIVPVLPPQAYSETDGVLNVDGDRAAASVAGAVGASDLVILSNVRGLYRDYANEDGLVRTVSGSQMTTAMDVWAQGRMKRKVLGAQEALEGGVERVRVADGRTASPVNKALNGAGTMFTQ